MKRAAAPRRPRAPQTPAAGPIALDSSCWLEFFADTDRAELYAPAIDEVASLVVPVITIYEVVKKLARDAGADTAAAALSLMQRGRVVDVYLSATLDAAVNGLPMADSLIYAAARRRPVTAENVNDVPTEPQPLATAA